MVTDLQDTSDEEPGADEGLSMEEVGAEELGVDDLGAEEELGADEEDEGDDPEMEIDETSDCEDNHRAHELLQAAPDQAETGGGSSPMLLPYDDYTFVVRPIIHKHNCTMRTNFTQEMSPDRLVSQQYCQGHSHPLAPST